ncbi:hypothetical protein ACNUDN_05910 [Mycobacterium sp. smrl_JER01]
MPLTAGAIGTEALVTSLRGSAHRRRTYLCDHLADLVRL